MGTEAYLRAFRAKLGKGAFEFVERTPNMVVHKCTWAHKLVWNVERRQYVGRKEGQACRMRIFPDPWARLYAELLWHTQGYTAPFACSWHRLRMRSIISKRSHCDRCDVIKAFTQNVVTDAVLYVQQPPFLQPMLEKSGRPMVMRVVKALEGLKQSGHLHQVN